MTPAISATVLVFAFGARHLARTITAKPAKAIDRYCDRINDDIRCGQCRLIEASFDALTVETITAAVMKDAEVEWLEDLWDLPAAVKP